jgi:hypothetical protein
VLDIRRLREETQFVRDRLSRRGKPDIAENIDRVLAADAERRTLITEVEAARARRNEVSPQVGKLKQAGQHEAAEPLMKEMRELSDQMKASETRLGELEATVRDLLLNIPNIPEDVVPPGDENDNVLVRAWGEEPHFDFEPKPHWELGEALGILDLPRGVKVAGSGFPLFVGREGFVKNRYIGRTFIMPGQELRQKSVRGKLNAIDLEFRGRNVLLVDDSIVRGTTSAQIIELAREAGARKVYFASAAPPVRYPNVYGIDMAVASELVANGRSEDDVAAAIGADWLVYQDLGDLVAACRHDDARITAFDTSCFSGEYVTGDVTREFLARIEHQRSDGVRAQRLLDLPGGRTARAV